MSHRWLEDAHPLEADTECHATERKTWSPTTTARVCPIDFHDDWILQYDALCVHLSVVPELYETDRRVHFAEQRINDDLLGSPSTPNRDRAQAKRSESNPEIGMLDRVDCRQQTRRRAQSHREEEPEVLTY